MSQSEKYTWTILPSQKSFAVIFFKNRVNLPTIQFKGKIVM